MNKIAGSKILVTGGAGFIGSHIVDELLSEGVSKVVVLDNLSRGRRENLRQAKKSGKLELVIGDIRDSSLLAKKIKGVDYVFHEAVIRVTLGQDDPLLAHEVIATGTFNLFNACVKQKIKKVIVSSSTTVYGQPRYFPVDEDHPLQGGTFYGAAKIYGEFLLRAFHHLNDLAFICLRPFNVYGPRIDIYSEYQEVIPTWLESIDHKSRPVVHGDGEQALDFTHVDDVARASIMALESDIRAGFYNVGTGKQTSLNDLLDMLLKLTKSDLEPIYKDSGKRIQVSRMADTKKAEKDLGFKARVKLKDGLKDLISWRENGKRASKKTS